MPKAHGHKQKKKKYYVSHRDDSPTRSIMSGDSPNAHRNEIFDFKEGRSSPIATSSKDVGIQSGSGIVTASVLVEPSKHKDNENETIDLSSPILNSSTNDDRRNSDAEKTVQLEEPYSPSDGKREERKKINGDYDKLDGVWKPKDNQKEQTDDEDENCVVQCLYYTMQCCDCAIM